MSYILEALKKAQAERQLGNAPTIHAPQPVQAAPARAAASRKPLVAGVAAGVLLACTAAVVALRHQPPVQLAAAVPAPAAVAPMTAAPPVPAAQTVPAPMPPAPQERSAPKAAPQEQGAPKAAPVRQPRQAPPPPPAASHREAPRARPPAAEPALVQAPAPSAPAPNSPAPDAEDNVRNLNELPEPIQREVPKVVFGGYIYSPNPADRLLLIDKMLRHEGEVVAPGLVLEKLQPKGAVMNYRGYRYRVAY